MKNGWIYISYDGFDYIDYFHLIIDDEFVLKFVPNEEIDRLFCYLDQMDIKDSDIAWCIAADQDATDWEYEHAFSERGRKINAKDNIDVSHLTKLLKEEFGMDFTFECDENADKHLSMYFPKQSKSGRLSVNKEELISKTKEIFDRSANQEEITEFAKIILEKYERMSQHEQF